MIISVNKKIFSESVQIVSRFSDRKNVTLPVLSSILFIVNEEGIKMRATNLEVGIDFKIDGNIKQNGVVAIPSSILQQIAYSMVGDGNITIEHSGDIVSIIDGSGKSSIKTFPYNDFPSIPFPENHKNRTIISGEVLKNLFLSVVPCASISTIRPELSSIYLSIEGGILTAVATDSFRLVEKRIPLKSKGVQGRLLIPAKNTLDIAQALPMGDIILSFDEHQCAFISDYSMFVSRLTNAVYPDYRQIIPKESITEAVVLRKDFEIALKKTIIFSDSFQKIKINLDPKKNTITLFAKNTDIGESFESLKSNVLGSYIDLSFNHKYLSTPLTLTETENISLNAAGIGRPLIVRGVGDTSFLYLVSPMNQ